MSLQDIISLVETYNYFLLFPLAIIEGPIMTVIAGLLCSLGLLNPYLSYLVIIFGDLTADSLYYALGHFGRKKFIKKWGHYMGITTKRVKKLESHFKKHTGKTLIIGKFSHGIGVVVLTAAGISNIPFLSFLWYNLIATLPKSMLLLIIGYHFGKTYNKIGTYLDYTAYISVFILITAIVVYYVIKKLSQKKEIEYYED